jgi:hypothetical protein
VPHHPRPHRGEREPPAGFPSPRDRRPARLGRWALVQHAAPRRAGGGPGQLQR